MSVAMCSCDSEAVSRSGKVGTGGENLLIKKRKEGKCERRKHSNKTERADRQRAALRSREGHAACQGTARQFRVLSAHISGEPAVVSRPPCPELQPAGGAVHECEGLLPGNGALDFLCKEGLSPDRRLLRRSTLVSGKQDKPPCLICLSSFALCF